jgi:hypothetical protein
MSNTQLAHPFCNMSKGDKLDWDRATITRIVAMLCQQPEGYSVVLALGSFVTTSALTLAA